jgi:hypothetical protein
MVKFRFGLAAALALGFGALAAAPAQAQGVSVTFSTGGNPGYVPVPAIPVYRPAPVYREAPVYPAAPVYRRPRYERQVYYRPAPPPPRCYTRMERYWDGWSWVERPERFCR